MRRPCVGRPGDEPPMVPEQPGGDQRGPAPTPRRSASRSTDRASAARPGRFRSVTEPPRVCEVTGREDIGPAEREQQVDLRRPTPRSSDRGQRRLMAGSSVHGCQLVRVDPAFDEGGCEAHGHAAPSAATSPAGAQHSIVPTAPIDPTAPARRARQQGAARSRRAAPLLICCPTMACSRPGKPGIRVRHGSGPAAASIPARSGSRRASHGQPGAGVGGQGHAVGAS